MLSLRHLVKTYSGASTRRVLNGISLELAPGECIAIMGDSGVGKSTLLNLIAGLDVPDEGDVLLEGRSMSAMDDEARTLLRRARIGFVFQAFHLLPHMSVAANVGLPLALNGTPVAASRARIGELLTAVGLAERSRSLPRELSGGEMQRVAVARALVHRPAVVLADEPTGNLDAESAALVLHLLRDQARKSNAMLILVTHSLTAAHVMDRVLQLTPSGLEPHV
ncbi:MAG TPA: ABC transporter ATP-binding protein [Steroidobacteraceae bacterium]|nr:ABC transporter ATP-binding protein [Steroidobacteraceae bacterium]